jgi:hypothetical protein
MLKEFKAAIIGVGIFFTASAAGGIFILNQWRVVPEPVEENLIIEELATVPEAPQATSSEVMPEIAQEIQKVIEASAELSLKTQSFVRSSNAKGVYINEFVANYQTPFAQKTRENIKEMLRNTELNAVVIDIKENNGPHLSGSLKAFIDELHQDDVWVIARICSFRDTSLINEKPEWYLKDATATSTATSTDTIWRDASGAAWFDPASLEAQQYLVDFSKQAIDFGFDELQFDYIRFPSDGAIRNIIYPFYDISKPKHETIGGFFAKLSQDLRAYKSSIILSVDLFGYLATQYQSFDIGQRLFDAGQHFDYLSFMLYPSHFYGGFSAPYDAVRELPALNLSYNTTNTDIFVSSNPYPVIQRSVLASLDYLAQYNLGARVRPWLQDFNLNHDLALGVTYDAEKIRAQIQGAEDAGSGGWLLWNSANLYSADALE